MNAYECPYNQTGDILLDTHELLNAATAAVHLKFAPNADHIFDANQFDSQTHLLSPEKFTTSYLPLLLDNAILETSTAHVCSRVRSLESGTFLGAIFRTYVQPAIIFFTIITNCLIAIIFTRPSMRNPTNTILLSISIVDLLTVLLPLPIYLCFLTSNIFAQNLNISKGYTVYYLTTILPTLFHTSSIWLTVLLALQRFVYVQFPLKANQIFLCRLVPIQWSIVVIVFAALGLQLPFIINTRYTYSLPFCAYQKHSTNPNTTLFETDSHGQVSFLQPTLLKCTPMKNTTFFSFVFIRILSANIIPCLTLTIFTGLLIIALKRFIQNRKQLLNATTQQQSQQLQPKQQQQQQQQQQLKRPLNEVSTQNPNDLHNHVKPDMDTRLKMRRGTRTLTGDTDSTSIMMLVVLGIFLLTELPTTICLSIYAFATLLGTHLSSLFFVIIDVCNLLVVLSYPANFFVYFTMSTQFKNMFWSLFGRFKRNSQNHAGPTSTNRKQLCIVTVAP